MSRRPLCRSERGGRRRRRRIALALAFALPLAALAGESRWRPSEPAEADGRRVELRATDARLASALEHLAAVDGLEAHVSDSIGDRVAGRLSGTSEELRELLVDTHGLSVYRDGERVWFDREGQRVVDFVRLDKAELVEALTALSRPVGVGGTAVVDASGQGLVLSGTRAYVQTSLDRIALALGRETDEEDARGAPPTLAAASPARRAAPPDVAGALFAATWEEDTRRLPLEDPATERTLGARIVLVSSRAPRAVVLEDGERLAPGETLPAGHRIVAIEREVLLLERDGVQTLVSLP